MLAQDGQGGEVDQAVPGVREAGAAFLGTLAGITGEQVEGTVGGEGVGFTGAEHAAAHADGVEGDVRAGFVLEEPAFVDGGGAGQASYAVQGAGPAERGENVEGVQGSGFGDVTEEGGGDGGDGGGGGQVVGVEQQAAVGGAEGGAACPSGEEVVDLVATGLDGGGVGDAETLEGVEQQRWNLVVRVDGRVGMFEVYRPSCVRV